LVIDKVNDNRHPQIQNIQKSFELRLFDIDIALYQLFFLPFRMMLALFGISSTLQK
jgi:hypothetical protein